MTRAHRLFDQRQRGLPAEHRNARALAMDALKTLR